MDLGRSDDLADFSVEDIYKRMRTVERLVHGYIDDGESTSGAIRELNNLTQTWLKLVSWIEENAPEAPDDDVVRDFRRYREVMSEFLGPNGMRLFTCLFIYHFGDEDEKEDMRSLFRGGVPSDSEIEPFVENLNKRWNDDLARLWGSNSDNSSD